MLIGHFLASVVVALSSRPRPANLAETKSVLTPGVGRRAPMWFPARAYGNATGWPPGSNGTRTYAKPGGSTLTAGYRGVGGCRDEPHPVDPRDHPASQRLRVRDPGLMLDQVGVGDHVRLGAQVVLVDVAEPAALERLRRRSARSRPEPSPAAVEAPQ